MKLLCLIAFAPLLALAQDTRNVTEPVIPTACTTLNAVLNTTLSEADEAKLDTVRIQKAIGLRITVHQFRHAAAAIYLKHRPGDYEMIRRLLGHRDIQTTIRFYCGLETMQATEDFGKLIRQQIKFDPIDA